MVTHERMTAQKTDRRWKFWKVASSRQQHSASRRHLNTLTLLHYQLSTFGCGAFRSPVQLCLTLSWIFSMIQHWVLTVLGNYLKLFTSYQT